MRAQMMCVLGVLLVVGCSKQPATPPAQTSSTAGQTTGATTGGTNNATNNAGTTAGGSTGGATTGQTGGDEALNFKLQEITQGSQWAEVCPKLKAQLKRAPGTSLKYEPLPTPTQHAGAWKLTWAGIDLAIPAAPYAEVALAPIAPGYATGPLEKVPGRLLLVTKAKTVITTLAHSPETLRPQEDLFATFDEKTRKPVSTEAGKAATTRLFGGPISSTALYRRAYEHTPDDLRCEGGEGWEKEAALGYALILGGIADPAQVRSIHDGVGSRKGWLKHSTSRDPNGLISNTWEAFVQLDERTMAGVLVADKAAPEAFALGALIGREFKEEPSVPRPKWLDALQAFLDRPSKARKDALKKAIKDAGMSERSVQSIEKITL